MKYNKMKATIKGRTHNNHPNFPDHEFEVILFFKLIPPEAGEKYYGTGYYMSIGHSNNPGPHAYVDVRYEGTTDIEILADRWIKNYYGENAEEVSKEFIE